MLGAAILLFQAPIFDLTFPATPVSQVVAELSKKSGETLSVAPNIGKEILALRFRKTTLPSAMLRLAEGLNAAWKDGTLVRTSDQLNKERQAFADLCRRTLPKDYHAEPGASYDIPAFLKAVKLTKEFDLAENWPAFRTANAERDALAPITQLSHGLDRLLTSELCERLGPGHFVFHSSPNALQHPLSGGQKQAFARYQATQNTLQKIAPEITDHRTVDGLEIICDIEPSSIQARFIVLDRERLGITGGECGDRRLTHVLKPRLQSRPEEEPEIAVSSSQDREEALSLLKNHRLPEPLSGTGKTLLRCAQERNEDLFAILGDDLIAPTWRSSMAVKDYLERIAEYGYDVQETPGQLQVTPYDRAEIRRQQSDRSALSEYINLNLDSKAPSLKDLIRLSPKLPFYDQSGEINGWITSLGIHGLIWNEPAMEVIGHLPRGRNLRYQDLPSSLRTTLAAELEKSGPGDFREKYVAFCATGWETTRDRTDDEPQPPIPPNAIVRVEESTVPCYSNIAKEHTPWSAYQVTAEIVKSNSLTPDPIVCAGRLHRLDISIDLGGGQTYLNRLEALEVTHPTLPMTQLEPTLKNETVPVSHLPPPTWPPSKLQR